MPRLRRATSSSEFPTTEVESQQLRLQPIEPSPRSVRDSAEFLLAVIELERVRKLRVHPESPTRH
jgi:hypothetical protein